MPQAAPIVVTEPTITAPPALPTPPAAAAPAKASGPRRALKLLTYDDFNARLFVEIAAVSKQEIGNGDPRDKYAPLVSRAKDAYLAYLASTERNFVECERAYNLATKHIESKRE